MSEIYRDSIAQAVTLDLNATGVTARIGRTLDDLSSTPVSFVPAPNYNAALVPYTITRNDGKFFVEWTYTIEGNQYLRIDQHEVVTPLVVRSETGLSQEDYDELEPIVRWLVHGYTHNYFGYYDDVKTVYGEDYDYLVMPIRLDNLNSVTFDGYEYSAAGFIVSSEGRYLNRSLEPLAPVGSVPADDSIIVPPCAKPRGIFWEKEPYLIDGGWGYRSVPVGVREAAKLLFADYSCMDAKYRNRYLQNARAADWRIQFNNKAFIGTGNLTADQLLGEYVIPGWGLV